MFSVDQASFDINITSLTNDDQFILSTYTNILAQKIVPSKMMASKGAFLISGQFIAGEIILLKVFLFIITLFLLLEQHLHRAIYALYQLSVD